MDRVFITSDEANMKKALEWSERAYTLADSFDITSEPVFGTMDSNNFIHTTQEQFTALRTNVKGSLGEYFKGGKNLFTRSGIITNHLISSYPLIQSTVKNFDGVHILSKILSSNYLLKHVREEGGAYGVGTSHDDQRNLFTSYDDPHVLRTIDQFVKGCEWIQQKKYSTRDIQEARLSLFSEIDAPVVPQQLGYGEVFAGKTAEKRQAQRDVLLSLSEEALHEIGEKAYACDPSQMTTCVFGNAESMKEVEKKGDWIVDELPLNLNWRVLMNTQWNLTMDSYCF